jgi:hypothetical protein
VIFRNLGLPGSFVAQAEHTAGASARPVSGNGGGAGRALGERDRIDPKASLLACTVCSSVTTGATLAGWHAASGARGALRPRTVTRAEDITARACGHVSALGVLPGHVRRPDAWSWSSSCLTADVSLHGCREVRIPRTRFTRRSARFWETKSTTLASVVAPSSTSLACT